MNGHSSVIDNLSFPEGEVTASGSFTMPETLDGVVVSVEMSGVLPVKTKAIGSGTVTVESSNEKIAAGDTITVTGTRTDNEMTNIAWTVKDYTDVILAGAYELNADGSFKLDAEGNKTVKNEEYAKAYELVQSMVYYGRTAQQLFNYNREYPADENLDDYEETIPDVSATVNGKRNAVPDYNSGSVSLTYFGSSLVLRSKTVYKLYFSAGEAVINDDFISALPKLVDKSSNTEYAPFKQTLGGKDYVCYEITDIAPQSITEDILLKYSGVNSDITVNISEYADLVFAYKVDKEAAVINALYNYSTKAQEYLSQNSGSNGGNGQ